MRAQQQMHFFKNLALLGGLILAAVDTEGEPSLGWRARRRGRQLESGGGPRARRRHFEGPPSRGTGHGNRGRCQQDRQAQGSKRDSCRSARRTTGQWGGSRCRSRTGGGGFRRRCGLPPPPCRRVSSVCRKRHQMLHVSPPVLPTMPSISRHRWPLRRPISWSRWRRVSCMRDSGWSSPS